MTGWSHTLASTMPTRPDWLLADGSSLIFRAFFGVPKAYSPDGRLVNGVRGFLDILARLINTRRPEQVAVASDEDWRPKHRVDLLPAYKAHRVAEPIPPELAPQMPLVTEVLAALGVDFVGAPNLEAEDVIASWVAQLGDVGIEIVSGDRDLFALVRDPWVKVLYPEKGGMAEITESEIHRRYDIPGRSYADFAVLRGDPSDGLPGLPGVGAKRASELVRIHGGVKGLLEKGRLSDADRDYLRRAWQVVVPGVPEGSNEVPLPEGLRAEYPAHPAELDRLKESLGLGGSVDRVLEALRSKRGARA
jgi:5'-3' exonuclease